MAVTRYVHPSSGLLITVSCLPVFLPYCRAGTPRSQPVFLEMYLLASGQCKCHWGVQGLLCRSPNIPSCSQVVAVLEICKTTAWGSSVTSVRSYLSRKGFWSLMDETDIPSSYLPESFLVCFSSSTIHTSTCTDKTIYFPTVAVIN